MRKYKVIIEAEIELNNYLDDIDLMLFNKNKEIIITDIDADFSSNYKLALELFNTCCGETCAIADINNINVEEIT